MIARFLMSLATAQVVFAVCERNPAGSARAGNVYRQTGSSATREAQP